MRVLLTGGSGQLGHELQRELSSTCDLAAPASSQLDIADRAAVLDVVDAIRPAVIVNAAAMTAVDACETDQQRAYRLNDAAVGHLVEAADRVAARFVHFSTDYVFDGTARRPYTETDEPNPQSVYGASKLAGERRLRPGDLCIRVAWLAGRHGGNVVKTVLRLAGQGQQLRFVDDQVGSPTFAADVADLTVRLLREGVDGLVHGANEGATSWYGYVGDILEAAGYPRSQVEPITTVQLDPPRPAPRPAYAVLHGAALRSHGFPPQPHYRESLESLLEQLRGDG